SDLRRDDEQDVVLGGELVDGLAQRVGAVGRAAAEAEVGDVGALGGGPLHAGDDRRVGAAAERVAHLPAHQPGARRHPGVLPAGGGAAAGDRAGHVGAVAVLVAGVGVGGEVLGGDHLAGQVRVGVVDAGVED